MNREEFIERLKASRRGMDRAKWKLHKKLNNSTDIHQIETFTRKIEMLNIIRTELKKLIREL